jgi:catechol 2,3-dioxygenase-like lactoylglutathione lyase family enzyme
MTRTDKPSALTPVLHLNGVDHTARPTWKLRETVEFYRDKLGLPLIHAITAKGWGRAKETHADFIHFFFEAGKGASIAFFYYIGTEQPPELTVPRGYMAMANHTAWRVETEADLLAWQARLQAAGVQVSQSIKHEILESIYFRDPNFYPLEITRPLRTVERIDGVDAEMTMAAALELEDGGGWSNIEQLWRLKAQHVANYQSEKEPAL